MAKKTVRRHSWEGIKLLITCVDSSGAAIDMSDRKFRFIYSDAVGETCEVSYDGTIRKNCVYKDGELFAVFEPHTFQYGRLTVEQHFESDDPDFKNGVWVYGGKQSVGIKIV